MSLNKYPKDLKNETKKKGRNWKKQRGWGFMRSKRQMWTWISPLLWHWSLYLMCPKDNSEKSVHLNLGMMAPKRTCCKSVKRSIFNPQYLLLFCFIYFALITQESLFLLSISTWLLSMRHCQWDWNGQHCQSTITTPSLCSGLQGLISSSTSKKRMQGMQEIFYTGNILHNYVSKNCIFIFFLRVSEV